MASEKGPNNDQPQASPRLNDRSSGSLEVESSAETTPSGRYRVSFWMCFISLCMSLFLFAMELTSVSTALPTITRDLQLTEFVWVGAAYALASAAWIPLCGNFAEIFGRRSTMIASVTLFAVGSAMCGAAKNSATIIAGRTVQGLGGGAIVALGMFTSRLLSLNADQGIYCLRGHYPRRPCSSQRTSYVLFSHGSVSVIDTSLV